MELTDKVVVVTGASRGIGLSTALALAEAGAHVVCAGRTVDAKPARVPGTIDETARRIEAMGGRALAVPTDLMQDDQVEALAARTMDEFGRVDIIINNAGYLHRDPISKMTMKRWDIVQGVNLRGAVMCTKAFLPHMIERRRGSIINVSSGSASSSPSMLEVDISLGMLCYAIAKLGVERLTEGLALELRPHGISVNCLRVELNVAAEGPASSNPDIDYSGAEPPEVAAEALLWLARRDASYTGRIVSITEIRQWRLLSLFKEDSPGHPG
jgi:citronellol/citronellal dehydrogenase